MFREEIYDDPNDPDDKWDHRARLSRAPLEAGQIFKRFNWGKYMKDEVRHTDEWFYNSLIWCDLCSSIIPRTLKKATEQKQAREGGRGWGSKAS